MALDIALRGAQHAGASIELIDLREYELPFCAGKMGELERSEDKERPTDEIICGHLWDYADCVGSPGRL